jgi:topoisomerase IV subunit A
MEDFKHLMQSHYLKYASYVILDRAIPNVVDGLKPVQRRILQTLWAMNDGKLHKVANVAGQTMVLHPHGDAPITEALINMANKGFMFDMQGNFGNIFTGDPAAAARYIETRLSALALETMFNPKLTATTPSYDGRRQEALCLPAKIPLLLMQGVDGIAVGMSTHILPHNFVELLEAEIAILEEREFVILPDFPTGGIMDASQYDKGKGKIKLRAKLEEKDPKTIVITEVCYGTTTESLIRSIDEAAKRGKIKIEAINDYTADKVEIEIKLPRGIYASDMIKALYGYTECEVTLHSQLVVIKDAFPWETDVDQILHFHIQKLQDYLKLELELERDQLLEKIFDKTLEQIFIENRLYKAIENVSSNEKIHETVAISLKPFHSQLLREPHHEDREKLLNIPIRRISKFDLDKNQEEIANIRQTLVKIEKDLKNVKKFTINYLHHLIAKFGGDFKRKTQLNVIEQIDKREIATKNMKIGFDPLSGFIGTKVTGETVFECTNYDKLLLLLGDGTYTVINIPEKQYVHQDKAKVVYAGIADKKSVFSIVYRDPKTYLCYVKRFVIAQFILEKNYRFFDKDMELKFLSTEPNIHLELQLIPAARQRVSKISWDMSKTLVKGVSSKGVRMSTRAVKKVATVKG